MKNTNRNIKDTNLNNKGETSQNILAGIVIVLLIVILYGVYNHYNNQPADIQQESAILMDERQNISVDSVDGKSIDLQSVKIERKSSFDNSEENPAFPAIKKQVNKSETELESANTNAVPDTEPGYIVGAIVGSDDGEEILVIVG